mmetsp:Transcript_4502/g.10624  ORF Transcript_4502/g.10624 Transcript_4502/m.10624 type:complete len:254 (-) Transcript_4502:1834-2595(-)
MVKSVTDDAAKYLPPSASSAATPCDGEHSQLPQAGRSERRVRLPSTGSTVIMAVSPSSTARASRRPLTLSHRIEAMPPMASAPDLRRSCSIEGTVALSTTSFPPDTRYSTPSASSSADTPWMTVSPLSSEKRVLTPSLSRGSNATMSCPFTATAKPAPAPTGGTVTPMAESMTFLSASSSRVSTWKYCATLENILLRTPEKTSCAAVPGGTASAPSCRTRTTCVPPTSVVTPRPVRRPGRPAPAVRLASARPL